MWFMYVIMLMATSVGAGSFMAFEVESDRRASILQQNPDTRAQLAEHITRNLRRFLQMDPTRFPQPQGNAVALIPQQLVDEALIAGRNMPQNVEFYINSSGLIYPEIAQQDGFNSDRFQNRINISGAVGHTQNMTMRDRDLNRIDRSQQYNFDETNNYENLEVGANPVRSGGGITN